MSAPKQPEVNRALMEVLIQATEQVLIERGPAGVTMIRIAARAGLSIDAIMQSLPNKETIVAEAMERLRKRGAAEAVPPPASSVVRPQASPSAPPVRRTTAPPAAAARADVPAPPAGAGRSGPPAAAAAAARAGVPAPPAVAGRSGPPATPVATGRSGSPATPAATGRSGSPATPATAGRAVPAAPAAAARSGPPAAPAGAGRSAVPAPPPTAARPGKPPPASGSFRAPASPPAPARSGTPATSRQADAEPPSASARRPKPPLAPEPRRETLEGAITTVVHQIVSALAEHLPSMASMPQSDRDAIYRVELDRMAKASEAMLARHQVSGPSHVAHVMTLSCDRVIKDVIRSAPESFSDGRLERALCRLCLDFVRSE